MSSFKQSLLKKNLWLYFFSFLIAPTGYIVKIVVSGDISIEELGVLYAIISFITILSAYNDFGMTESMNYFLPKYLSQGKREKGKVKSENSSSWFHEKFATNEHGDPVNSEEQRLKKVRTTQLLVYALSIQMFTSLVLGCILFFVAPWLSEHYFQSESALTLLRIFILFFFGENLFKTLTTFFQAAQNPKLQKGAEFVRMITLVAYVVAIFTLDLGKLETYAWGWIIALAIGVIFSGVMLLTKYRRILNFEFGILNFDGEFFKSLMKYAIWVVLTANAATLLSQIDMQMIIAMLGPKEAGYYTNYLSVMRIPFIFLLPGVVFLFPVFSDLFAKKDFQKIAAIRKVAYKYFSVLGIMTGSFFFLFGTELTVLLFGETFAKSGEILLYSSLFLVFNFLLQIDFQIFSGTGRPRQKMYILLIGIVVNFFTNLVLINSLGVFGAALATGLGWIVLWFLAVRRVGSDYHFRFDTRFFAKNFVTLAIASVIVHEMVPGFEMLNRVDIALHVLLALVLYLLLFLILNFHDLREIKQTLIRG